MEVDCGCELGGRELEAKHQEGLEHWKPGALSGRELTRLFPPTENSNSLVPGLCCNDLLRRATICRMRVGAPAARSPKRAPPPNTRAAYRLAI